MTVIRGMILFLLMIGLAGCSSIFGHVLPTIPKGVDVVRQSSGHEEACNKFEIRYGGDEGSLSRFATTLVTGKWQPPKVENVSVLLREDAASNEEAAGYLTHQRIRDHFDNFLDCYFVDLSTQKQTYPEDQFRKFNALRGHVIVTVLARYAAYNMTGRIGGGLHTTDFPPYEDLTGDASNMLTRIEYAQRIIRRDAPEDLRFNDAEQPQVGKTAESLDGFPGVQRVNRVFSVVQVAFEAERPTLRRAQGFLTGLAGLITGQSVTDYKNVVKHAIAGLEKAALLGVYSRAYQFDADAIFKTISGEPDADDWKKIDAALRDACEHLATIAGGAVPHCLPSKATSGEAAS